MLASFVFAIVITYLFGPISNFLERRGVPRQLSVLIPFLAGGLLIVLIAILVAPLISDQLQTLMTHLPSYQIELSALAKNVQSRIESITRFQGFTLAEQVSSFLQQKILDFSNTLPSVISKSFTVLILAPFLSFFMLLDGRTTSKKLLSLVPNNLFEVALFLHHRINEQLGGFIRARFLEAAIVGFVVWIGLLIVGFPYATLLAIIAALTNLIPYLGPLIGAAPALLIALVSTDARITASVQIDLLIVSAIYFAAQLIDMIFVIPLVVAKIVNLHPVTVIIVIILGSQVLGILGMIISIPVASTLKLIGEAVFHQVLRIRT